MVLFFRFARMVSANCPYVPSMTWCPAKDCHLCPKMAAPISWVILITNPHVKFIAKIEIDPKPVAQYRKSFLTG